MKIVSRGLGYRGLRASNTMDAEPRDLLSEVYGSCGESAGGPVMDASVYFNFVSTASSFIGRTSAANGPNTDAWIIEGVNVGLNPGTITFTAGKDCVFRVNPPSSLTIFYLYGNSLTGLFPSFNELVSLTKLACDNNSISGSIPSFTTNTALQEFYCQGNLLTGSIPSFTTNVALKYFYCYGNALTGSIPSLTTNTALIEIACQTNQLSGSIPSFATNTALTTFRCYDNQLTDVAGGFAVPATCTSFQAQNNLLTQAAVDAILAAFVTAGASGAYALNVGGTGNALPSAGGATSKTTLQGRGWTVTTN